jgi:hypothetical protein
MSNIDKTKKNIGVSQLDVKEKKQLFEKFVDAGGKVIKEKRKGGMSNFNRQKQGLYKNELERQRQKLKSTKRQPEKKQNKSVAAAKTYTPDKRMAATPFRRFLTNLHIHLKLFFMGVSDISVYYFTKKFLESLNLEVRSALLEVQLVYMEIFKQNYQNGLLIIDELDNLNPLYYELIEMSSEIFDRTIMNQIVEHYVTFPNVAQRTTEIREPLMMLFRKIYILHAFYDFILYAFEKALAAQMKLENSRSSLYSASRKQLKNNLNRIFRKFFNQLYWLFCFYNKLIFPLQDREIEQILSISEDEIPGKRSRMQSFKDNGSLITEPAQEEQKDDADSQETSLPPEIKMGLELMYAIEYDRIRALYDKEGIFKFANDNDKIFLTYVLFKEFDNEYSFILTTNKIKYTIQFTNEGKKDYRMLLSDLYNELRKCMKNFTDYAEVLGNYAIIKRERPESSSQYIEYSNRLTESEKKRQIVAKEVRMSLKTLMEKIVNELGVFITDMDGTQKAIDNPQDELVFEATIEGIKKMHGKKVYAAIQTAYNYAAAFGYRLSIDGDLYGQLEFNEEELKNIASNAPDKSKENSSDAHPEEEKNRAENKNVIKELDDLI